MIKKTFNADPGQNIFSYGFPCFPGFVVILEIAVASDVVHTVSFEMDEGNPKEDSSTISCTQQAENYVHVVTASGYKEQERRVWGLVRLYNETYELSKFELFSLEWVCSCEEQCVIPQLLKEGKPSMWTLVIKYKCLGLV